MTSIINFDRFMMGFTLGSHILIVTLTIGISVVMSIIEFLGIFLKDRGYEVMARRLSRALAIFFAIGTASGTVLAIELFSLWPNFMVLVGKIDILPFYYEVFAFFLESISLVLYIYYWDYFKNRYQHWLLSLFVAAGTLLSAVFITMVNAWMNTPAGFNLNEYRLTGKVVDVNPLAAMFSPSSWVEIGHVVPATLAAGSFALLAYFAINYLRSKTDIAKSIYMKSIKVAAIVGLIAIGIAGLTGDESMRMLYSLQPLKYAALELNFNYTTNAAEKLGGIVINGKPQYYIAVPGLQEFIMFLSFNAHQPVPYLNAYPKSEWPPLFVHLTFDTMVGGGALVGLFALLLFFRIIFKKDISGKFYLYSMIISGILLEIVYDSGWVTDEVGRQPYIIYNNIMTVASAANTSPSVLPLGIGIIIFYLIVVPFTFYFSAKVLGNVSIEREIERVGDVQ